MRTFLLFVKTTLVSLGLLFGLEMINHYVTYQRAFDITKDYLMLIVFMLVIPVNAVLHHRIVDRVYAKDQVTLEQIESILKDFKAKHISSNGALIEYALPASAYWEKKVLIEVAPDGIKISAPVKLIRKIDQQT